MKNRVSYLLKELGISGYEFARQTGITQTTVYLLKNNPNQFPSGDIFDRIIDTYGVAIADIVER